MKKLFQIWCEGNPRFGYTAAHLGVGKGSTFLEACEDLASKNLFFHTHFNRSSMIYDNAAIFDSEEKARERFG